MGTLTRIDRFVHGGEVRRVDTADRTAAARATAALVGRVLMASIFLVSGVGKLAHWATTAGHMEAQGVPMVPLALGLAAAVEIGGGLSLLLGWWTRVGALALALFLVPVTLVFHAFWTFEGPEALQQQVNFLKNVAIVGGLLVIVAHGPGRASLDTRSSRG